MAIKQRKDEGFDSLLKRFRAEVNNAGTLREVRIHTYYMSPKERRAEKTARNQKRVKRTTKIARD